MTNDEEYSGMNEQVLRNINLMREVIEVGANFMITREFSDNDEDVADALINLWALTISHAADTEDYGQGTLNIDTAGQSVMAIFSDKKTICECGCDYSSDYTLCLNGDFFPVEKSI